MTDAPTTVLHKILARGDFAPITRQKYTLVINRWIAFAGADPVNWTRHKAQDFYDGLLESGITAASANAYMKSLRYVSRWYATHEGRPELDFIVAQQRKGKASKKRESLDPAAVVKLLDTCKRLSPIDRRDFVMLVIALETGMRRMSLADLWFDRISEQRGYPIITVSTNGEGGEATFDVPLSDVAYETIDRWQQWLGKTTNAILPRCQHTIDIKKNRHNHHFTKHAIGLNSIYDTIVERGETAGIGHVFPHQLRHTFITWRRVAGLNAAQIASITGHSITGTLAMDARPGDQVSSAMAGYFDLREIAKAARNSTPPWLATYVRKQLQQF